MKYINVSMINICKNLEKFLLFFKEILNNFEKMLCIICNIFVNRKCI